MSVGPLHKTGRKAVSAAASAPHVTVTLPDGKALTVTRGTTPGQIAASIGPGLAKAALIAEVNGKEWDLFRPIEEDAGLRIITKKNPEGVGLVAHHHQKRPRGAGADPARHGACAGHGGAGALPRHAGDHWPRD